VASRLCALVCVVVLCVGAGSASAGEPATAPDGNVERRLVVAEEFSGTVLDRSVWSAQMSWGHHTTGELQYYTDDSVVLADGALALTARKRLYNGYGYTSGVVSTHDRFSFAYGYAEIRARVPRGKGFFPAFWLAPADPSVRAEIDVMEILGQDPNKVYMTMHYTTADGRHYEPGRAWVGPDFSDGYHTFAVDWQPGLCVWYVDGVERARQAVGVPSTRMHLIANLAIGGPWPGSPDASTPFPESFDIDYIRVYEAAEVEPEPAPVPKPLPDPKPAPDAPPTAQPAPQPDAVLSHWRRVTRVGKATKSVRSVLAAKRLAPRGFRLPGRAVPGLSGSRTDYVKPRDGAAVDRARANRLALLWIHAPHWMR
jgi:beta-glucanase (GH16 family)